MDGYEEKLSVFRFCVGRYFVYSQCSPVITSHNIHSAIEAVMSGKTYFSEDAAA